VTQDQFTTGMRRLSWFAVPVTLLVAAFVGAATTYDSFYGFLTGLFIGAPLGFVMFGLVRMMAWVGKGFFSGSGKAG